MRSVWWLAVALIACGDVNVVPDAAVPDAYEHDAAVAPMCGPGEMSCGGICADLMTSQMNCGTCGTMCAPNHKCLSGACAPYNTSCARVKEIDPAATDGAYQNTNTGQPMYCDFTNNMTYEGFGLGANTGSYAGYVFMSTVHLNDAAIRKAFIKLFNEQGGLLNLQSGWSSGNCCFKAGDSAAGQYLALGGKHLYPAKTATAATQCGGQPYTDARYRFYEAESGPYAPVPLPDDYFTTRAASQVTNCSDTFPMPGFFMKRRVGLN